MDSLTWNYAQIYILAISLSSPPCTLSNIWPLFAALKKTKQQKKNQAPSGILCSSKATVYQQGLMQQAVNCIHYLKLQVWAKVAQREMGDSSYLLFIQKIYIIITTASGADNK